MKVSVEIDSDSFKFLTEYLMSHESDIACGENDFNELRSLFVDFFGRPAERDKIPTLTNEVKT